MLETKKKHKSAKTSMLDNIKIKDIDDKEMNYTISITINIE
jgi:hypothetical protein